MTAVPSFFAEYRTRVEADLQQIIPAGAEPVQQAMAYTLHAPSKRVRAILTLLAAELCGGAVVRAIGAACAIEMVHAASLILDDLPSMDNAPLRRGKPANHVVYGEAIAILAAFGLLNGAFAVLAHEYDPPTAARLTGLVTEAVGAEGLIAGQATDLLATDHQITFETLERIHRRKTGALFSAAATAGAVTVNGTAEAIAALQAFAKNLGLAFQIIDDLLDVEGNPAMTGKPIREDLKKTTFVSFSGKQGARQLAAELCEAAESALVPFGRRATHLRELSAFVAGRMM
jgi:geranylgeranyl diphosphate synthase, type II